MTMRYVSRSQITMQDHPTLTERWLQDRIEENPALLGLGDVAVRDREKSQPGRGRLDFLLADDDNGVRYEVEIQLGATDESHIIRTLEYWDIEKRRYPTYDHVAVIVAEDITARFFNVIRLFNGFIPIVAIRVSAIDLGDDQVTLIFTRVLDHQIPEDDDDEDDRPSSVRGTRESWEERTPPEIIALMDKLVVGLQEHFPSARLDYKKRNISFRSADHKIWPMSCSPQQAALKVFVGSIGGLAQKEEYESMMRDVGLSFAYRQRMKGYYIKVPPDADDDACQAIIALCKEVGSS